MKKIIFVVLAYLLVSSCSKNTDAVGTASNTSNLSARNKMWSDDIPKFCVDMTLPPSNKATGKAVGETAKFWPQGKNLKILFMNGTPFLKSKVQQFANTWLPHINLTFTYYNAGETTSPTDIRIVFYTNTNYGVDESINPKSTGSFSYVGTDAAKLDQLQRTMNFGWFDENTSDFEFSRTVVHEFGHALGLVHEQSSPIADIKWNKPFVYSVYTRWPYNWTKEQVDANLFYKYSQQTTQYTQFDPVSIMQYFVNGLFTTDGNAIDGGTELSATDIKFIKTKYPSPQLPPLSYSIRFSSCSVGKYLYSNLLVSNTGVLNNAYLGNYVIAPNVNYGSQPFTSLKIINASDDVIFSRSVGSSEWCSNNTFRGAQDYKLQNGDRLLIWTYEPWRIAMVSSNGVSYTFQSETTSFTYLNGRLYLNGLVNVQ